MSNHFHLLVEVPDKERALEGWDDEKFLERLEMLNGEAYTRQVLAEITMWKRNGNKKAVHKAAMAVRERLFDLSVFVKELKFKFSVWHNRRAGRRRTLWEERFRSVLLEDGEAVRFCAAYIDLNPVRAGAVRGSSGAINSVPVNAAKWNAAKNAAKCAAKCSARQSVRSKVYVTLISLILSARQSVRHFNFERVWCTQAQSAAS